MRDDEMLQLLAYCRERGTLPNGNRECLLCRKSPDEMIFGLWMPCGKSIHSRLGCSKERIATGGGRVVLYMLCPNCFEKPNTPDEVAQRILKVASVK
jgi:hypothetical protein